MKKIYLFITTFLISILLMSCTYEGKIETIELLDDDFKTNYLINEEFDYDSIKVKVTFDTGEEETLTYENLDVNTIDTSKAGIQELIIKYKDETITRKIVISYDEVPGELYGYEKPEFVVKYESNIRINSKEDTGFINNIDSDDYDGYYVGSENIFKFYPIAVYLTEDENGEDKVLKVPNKENIINLYKYNEDIKDYELVDLVDYVDTDANDPTKKPEFKFKEVANNLKFKLEMSPLYDTIDADAINFEFTVVDAYNLYDSKEFSLLNTNDTEGSKELWNSFKIKNGIPTDKKINGLILHDNMIITKDDLTENLFEDYTDPNDGKVYEDALKDWKSIYQFKSNKDENFLFIGNYFNIDASKIPLVRNFKESSGSHSALFGFLGDDHNRPTDINIGPVTVKNISITGNTSRNENEENKGGLTLFRSSSKDFVLDNAILNSSFLFLAGYSNIDYTNELHPDNNKTTIKNSKGSDSFSNMFLAWGSTIDFVNSNFKNSGGPILALTYHKYNSEPNQIIPRVTTTDTNFSTEIIGSEIWFTLNHVETQAPVLKGLFDALHRVLLNIKGDSEYEYDLEKVDGDTTLIKLVATFFPYIDDLNSFTNYPYPIEGYMNYNNVGFLNPTNQNIQGIGQIMPALLQSPLFVSSKGCVVFLMDQETSTFGFINPTSTQGFTVISNNMTESEKEYLVENFVNDPYASLYLPSETNNRFSVLVEKYKR